MMREPLSQRILNILMLVMLIICAYLGENYAKTGQNFEELVLSMLAFILLRVHKPLVVFVHYGD